MPTFTEVLLIGNPVDGLWQVIAHNLFLLEKRMKIPSTFCFFSLSRILKTTDWGSQTFIATTIAGLHVMPQWPCWWYVGGEEQKHFSSLGTKPYFHVNSSRKILLY